MSIFLRGTLECEACDAVESTKVVVREKYSDDHIFLAFPTIDLNDHPGWHYRNDMLLCPKHL